VNPCTTEIGDVMSFIQKKLAANDKFYQEVHVLITLARLHGVNVDGWP
jgi:hypothetical protein